MRHYFQLLLLTALSVLVLTALTGYKAMTTVTTTPTITQTFTPMYTATPAATATPTITPTPEQLRTPAPIVPEVSAPISIENINKLTRLTSFGEGDLLGIQLSPDGKWIVLDTSNGLLVLDSTTLKKVLFLPTAMKPLSTSFIDNGNKLTTRDCYQGYVWSMPDGKEISHGYFRTDPGWKKMYWCSAMPDSNWEYVFVLPNADQKTGKYRFNNRELIYSVDFDAQNFVISPDDKMIVLSTSDKLVIMQYEDGKILKEIPEKGIKSLFFYPDGKTIAAIFQNQIKFWRTDDYEMIGTVNGSEISLSGFSPDHSILAIYASGALRFLRSEDRLLINAVSGRSPIFSSDSNGVFVFNRSKQVTYYSFNEDRSKLKYMNSFSGDGLLGERISGDGALSSDGTKLLVGNNSWVLNKKEILLYDVNNNSKLQNFPLQDENRSYWGSHLQSAVWIPNLNTYGVMVGTSEFDASYFGILDLKTGSITKYFDNAGPSVRYISFSSNSETLNFVTGNNSYAWDIKKNGYEYWEPYQSIPSGREQLSPNGKYKATIKSTKPGSEEVEIWNDGKLLYKLGGSYAVEFAFSADSNMIAISMNNQYGTQISFFDLSTGKEIFSTGGYFSAGYIPMVTFSPDGKYFAILTPYGYPQIWGIP